MQKTFGIRTYGYGELARLYFPDAATKQSATKMFSAWINGSSQLCEKLKTASWKKRQRYLSPKQVKVIVEHFDAPG